MTTDETDKIVLELLNKVEEKKKEIGATERPSWITNCSFGWTDSGSVNDRINIQVTRTLEELVEIMSFLILREKSWQESITKLGIKKTLKFKWLGFTPEEWESDIKTRINQIEIKAKKDELNKLEARVNALVSPEQRRALELKKLVSELA